VVLVPHYNHCCSIAFASRCRQPCRDDTGRHRQRSQHAIPEGSRTVPSSDDEPTGVRTPLSGQKTIDGRWVAAVGRDIEELQEARY
jgi:hypothetical protein